MSRARAEAALLVALLVGALALAVTGDAQSATGWSPSTTIATVPGGGR